MLYYLGQPCDKEGNNLPPGTPPPARVDPTSSDWAPFKTRVDFETAEFLYKKDQMSAGRINELMELWAASNVAAGGSSPFRNALDMYQTIDRAVLGDVPWESVKLRYQGEDLGVVNSPSPSWMTAEHTVWFRDPRKVVQNLLANADFMGETNLAPHRDYDAAGRRQYSDFMSGDWAWEQAVRILDIRLLTSLIKSPGCPRVRSEQLRRPSGPHSSGQRQDDGIRYDGSHRILPFVSLNWERQQQCAPWPSRCRRRDRFPRYSNR